jgi:hypothetical protein
MRWTMRRQPATRCCRRWPGVAMAVAGSVTMRSGIQGRIVCVVCITDAQRMPAILEALKPLVERHIGIVSVSDVQVIRAGHF